MNAHALLAAYAEDVVRLESECAALRVCFDELLADVGTYRELTCAAFDALRHLTVTNQHLKNDNEQLRDQNRALWEELHVRADADVWVEAEQFEGAPA